MLMRIILKREKIDGIDKTEGNNFGAKSLCVYRNYIESRSKDVGFRLEQKGRQSTLMHVQVGW